MRQLVLDTETTGLDPARGHRIIEIGVIELRERRRSENDFHVYLNPDRDSDQGALEVHGLTTQFLSDKPRFADVARRFLDYIDGAQLIIHNAAFDLSFLDAELALFDARVGRISDRCSVIDTLLLARERFPGQRNSLDALCRRFGVDASKRELHGAKLDASLLAEVYLALTAGQASLDLAAESTLERSAGARAGRTAVGRLRRVAASAQDLQSHADRLLAIELSTKRASIWQEWSSGAGDN